MASVTYDHVTKRYSPELAAVKDLSMSIADKEFMVLVGPSGCGKTTALRMLAGLEEISEGAIRIGDQEVTDVTARDRDVAMVFQTYALYPHMTVHQNMAFALKMHHIPKSEIDTRVRGAADILELGPYLDRKPRQLSGGQRQRVALGRAIVRQPQVFLLDEPLSNLDAKLRSQTRIALQKLHVRLGTTFLYVTHDQVEAMTMGTRIAVMRDGVLQQVDSPSNLYNRPANVFVAGFIGTPTMNLVPATVDGSTARASGFEIQLGADPGVSRVILGIRPEIMRPASESAGSIIDAEVEVVELMGSDQFIYARAGADTITARLDPHFRVAAGERIRLEVTLHEVHLFDPETELALSTPQSNAGEGASSPGAVRAFD